MKKKGKGKGQGLAAVFGSQVDQGAGEWADEPWATDEGRTELVDNEWQWQWWAQWWWSR